MTYEFIIRDIKTRDDVYKVVKIPEARFDSVKKSYENALERVNSKSRFNEFVLLINRCDDNGDFEEIIQ